MQRNARRWENWSTSWTSASRAPISQLPTLAGLRVDDLCGWRGEHSCLRRTFESPIGTLRKVRADDLADEQMPGVIGMNAVSAIVGGIEPRRTAAQRSPGINDVIG